MEILTTLRSLNAQLKVYSAAEAEEHGLGRIVKEFDFSPCIKFLQEEVELPEAVAYVPALPMVEAMPFFAGIENIFYGEMPAQAGYCVGHNRRLNALEYHKGSEIVVAATDLALFLARLSDLRNRTLDACKVNVYLIPAGTAIELFSSTLHFAPAEVSSIGFRAGIILPKGTNLPLTGCRPEKDPLLFARNKWLIAHKTSPSAGRGAWIGIEGDNIELFS